MKRSLSSSPEAFSISPLLGLLPKRGTVSSLSSLEPALYARLEKVQQLGDDADQAVRAEELMLRQILDYLAMAKPEEI